MVFTPKNPKISGPHLHANPLQKYPLFANKSLQRNHCKEIIAIKSLQSNHCKEIIAIKSLNEIIE
jgi:hypothetical protein